MIKNLLILLTLAVGLYAGYTFFFAGDDMDLAVDVGASEGELMAGEFLMRLNELNDVSFSRDFFEDQKFRSLVSFTTAPESASAGRPDPFSR